MRKINRKGGRDKLMLVMSVKMTKTINKKEGK